MRKISRVENFYDGAAQYEWDRLERHRTEFAVTLRALKDYLPAPPARIADIGGGPGRYSIALAQRGYVVTLVDISSNSLAFAGKKAREAGVKLSRCVHACATDLSKLPAERFDAVLLMGPMYHLWRKSERQQAIREAIRLIKPNGLLFASFVTRHAVFRSIAKSVPEKMLGKRYRAHMYKILETGIYNPISKKYGWTHAYFAHPAEIKPLFEQAGMESLDLIGCEGVVSMIEDKVNELQGEAWEQWVELNYRLGKDPCLQGAAEHLLYVGKKQ